jgi:hypothetical protein
MGLGQLRRAFAKRSQGRIKKHAARVTPGHGVAGEKQERIRGADAQIKAEKNTYPERLALTGGNGNLSSARSCWRVP